MTTSMLASDNLDSIALLERTSAPSSYFIKEGFGVNIAKKLISELTCCIGCVEKGSDKCKWGSIKEKASFSFQRTGRNILWNV
ncbi:MAG: hypothetical protein ABIH85_03690 [Candidatus Omnitrophota bacterium]